MPGRDERAKPAGAASVARVAYEEDGLDLGAILATGAILVFAIAAVMVTVKLTLDFFVAHREGSARPAGAVSPRDVPPEPRLETSPAVELQALRAREDAQLSSYAWIDPERGIVRIPIARAMQIVARRGLPVTIPASPAVSPPASAPGKAER